jgi:hypothetical protein
MPNTVNTSDPNLFGTTRFPIQLVQSKNTFRTLQPLNNSQVTQIAKMLKQPRGNRPGVKDPQIVYEDKINNRKLVYKIVCKEDIQPPQPQTQIIRPEEPESSSESEDDLQEIRNSISTQQQEYSYSPQELMAMTDPATILNKKRKRGRPSEFEKFFMPKPKHKHAKKLKSEFGLTEAQAQAVEKDIVDDNVVEVEVKEEIDEEEAEKVLAASRTRSGRISRPPRTIVPNIDLVSSLANASTTGTISTTLGSILDLPNLPPPPPVDNIEPKARRKFNVPAKYRCRVCNKIYLGDRKMARHVKAYPGHGPGESTVITDMMLAQAAAADNKEDITTKSMSTATALSMPIIPLARTQLEDLVKNLDAELVLDCVSKKMFDNFSMWDLQLKKMQLNKQTGLKRLEIMLSDMETILIELKKMVDNCLTHTKLCDKPAPSVTLGEHLQLALNSHDGQMYLEQANHIPEEFHKYFGIQPIISSPRSESNTLVTNPEDDDNSNSLMSGISDKDHDHHQGLGAQMVLEQNLGVCPRDREDDLEDDEDDKKSRHESSSSKIILDDSLLHEDDDSNSKSSPKASLSLSVTNSSAVVTTSSAIVVKLGEEYQRTRLPSFSSIIAGSPKSELQDILSTPDDHHSEQHSNPPSRHGSIHGSSRRSSIEQDDHHVSTMRRCSLDQTALMQISSTDHVDSMSVRRASIDNGLMLRSTLESGFDFPSVTESSGQDLNHLPNVESGQDILDNLGSKSGPSTMTLQDSIQPASATSSTSTAVQTSTQLTQFNQAEDPLPVVTDEMFDSVTSISTSMSMAMEAAGTHVTFSQQLTSSGVQSLPPSGPPSVDCRPIRHSSMPSSPLGNLGTTPASDLMMSPAYPAKTKEEDFKPQQSQSSTSNFLSDLESVLNSAGDFGFATASSPEKILTSIPPSSMMFKPKNSGTVEDKVKVKAKARTDFLGALGGKSSTSTTAVTDENNVEAAKEANKEDEINTFDDNQIMIRSTLADPVVSLSTFQTPNITDNTVVPTNESDSLSQLFDEMTGAANAGQDQEERRETTVNQDQEEEEQIIISKNIQESTVQPNL